MTCGVNAAVRTVGNARNCCCLWRKMPATLTFRGSIAA